MKIGKMQGLIFVVNIGFCRTEYRSEGWIFLWFEKEFCLLRCEGVVGMEFLERSVGGTHPSYYVKLTKVRDVKHAPSSLKKCVNITKVRIFTEYEIKISWYDIFLR